jgi:mono/diheme cytochrome c family protein
MSNQYTPPQPRRGGRDINKMSRSHLRRSGRGGVGQETHSSNPHHPCLGFIALVTLLFVVGFACQSNAQQQYPPRPNYLASGDAVAGRRAYLALKCNTCHTVAGEPAGAKPPRLSGPQLGKAQATQSPQQIADSIAAPRHIISDKPGPWKGPAGSTMGDYTRVMTVRQLIDLVAYINSL